MYSLTYTAFVSLFVTIAYAQTPVEPWVAVPQPEVPAIMLKIADCESGDKQFYPDGSLVRDGVTGTHVGVYQISLPVWGEKAKELGDDLTTEKGNIDFALRLYKMYGTAPWLASRDSCWGNNDG